MDNISIAVIIPVYNVEKYLNRCIDSILAQTHMPNEIILVDDGSTDNSSEICDKYQSKTDIIRVIHQNNKGLAGAKNSGIDACKSEYIVFVDPDDYVEPSLLKNLLDGKKQLQADIICEPLTFEYPNGYKKKVPQFNSIVLDVYKSQGCILRSKYSSASSCAKLFPASVLRKVKFPEGKINEDVRTTILQIGAVKNVGFISTSDYHYIQRRGSILYGNQDCESVFDAISVCEKFQTESNSMYVKRGVAVRIYMLAVGYLKSTKKIPKDVIEKLQSSIRKQDNFFYMDPDNSLKAKIKYFLISRNILTFKIFILLQQIQIKLEAGDF